MLLNQLRSRPFEADPNISLQFSADGTTYQLRKTFAGSRGSVSLSDAAGGVLEGERAEERLAELVGATAVRGGNLSRLRERWAHLWVWQGQAGVDPLSLAPATMIKSACYSSSSAKPKRSNRALINSCSS